MTLETQETYFRDWKNREEIAESMLPLIGRLYRDHGVVTTVYGRSLVSGTTIDILRAHRFARQVLENELSVRETAPVLQAMANLQLAPARIDIGNLVTHWRGRPSDQSVGDFVRDELAGKIDRILDTAHALAQVDVLAGLARAAAENSPSRYRTSPSASASRDTSSGAGPAVRRADSRARVRNSAASGLA